MLDIYTAKCDWGNVHCVNFGEVPLTPIFRGIRTPCNTIMSQCLGVALTRKRNLIRLVVWAQQISVTDRRTDGQHRSKGSTSCTTYTAQQYANGQPHHNMWKAKAYLYKSWKVHRSSSYCLMKLAIKQYTGADRLYFTQPPAGLRLPVGGDSDPHRTQCSMAHTSSCALWLYKHSAVTSAVTAGFSRT